MSELDHEKEFEAYLAQRSRVRAGLGMDESLEPPEELDRIVLSQAREAIRTPPVHAGSTPRRAGLSQWAWPLR